MDSDILNFHIPRWEELPNIDLYMDQVVSLIEESLTNLVPSKDDKDDKVITKTMINNYVKHGILNSPVNKKYNRAHLARLIVICILKQVYSINDIDSLITLALKKQLKSFKYVIINSIVFVMLFAILFLLLVIPDTRLQFVLSLLDLESEKNGILISAVMTMVFLNNGSATPLAIITGPMFLIVKFTIAHIAGFLLSRRNYKSPHYTPTKEQV